MYVLNKKRYDEKKIKNKDEISNDMLNCLLKKTRIANLLLAF